MVGISRRLTPATMLMAGLALIVSTAISAQDTGQAEADASTVDQGAPAAEVDSRDSDAESGECPRCGRRRGPRGKGRAADSANETGGGRGCRCGNGGCRRGRGPAVANDAEAIRPRAGRGSGHGRQGGGGGRGKRAEMATYRELLENHESIERTFEKVPGGIRSVTTSSDPELVPVLRRHVAQMIDLLENGGWIRVWDPLFSEIFEHADKIETSIEEIEGGIAVTETSRDEQVALLIQAHAAKVMEFVDRGQEAYDEPTPLPEGYKGPGN